MNDEKAKQLFNGNKSRLKDCALEKDPNQESCRSLFNEYRRFYAKHYWNAPEHHHQQQQQDEDASLHQFQKTIRHVYHHNSKSSSLFQLQVNQFAIDGPPLLLQDNNQEQRRLKDREMTKRKRIKIQHHHRRRHHHSKTHNTNNDPFAQEPFDIQEKLETTGFAASVTLSPDLDGKVVEFSESRALLQENSNDPFHTSLNWATTNNPDGVALVHSGFDQGMSCGACWAYVTAGTLETSAARNAARHKYWEAITKGLSEEEASKIAKQVEIETFDMTRLSVQEMIDCDLAADKGCKGGNPFFAFFFIHRYGLVPLSEYLYKGREEKCQLKSLSNPLVTVQSWGFLPENDEDMIEVALRYIGPVAVDYNAGHPSFISYDGGIFDVSDCDAKVNHALLIVGYDQVNFNGTLVHYWIARNSWGSEWGENGYVRIKRGDDKGPGMCGLATSPSVALGGNFRTDRQPMWKDLKNHIPKKDHKHPYYFEQSKNYCSEQNGILMLGNECHRSRYAILVLD